MTQVAAALISGVVALLIGGTSTLLALSQIRKEHRRWLADLKIAWSLELYKARMATYPDVHKALYPLSHTATVTPQAAEVVARELNEWIYSAGGLCAEATTRGAVLGLRDCCRKWAEDGGSQSNDLYTWRNLTTTFLRRDLDLGGLDSYDFDLDSTLLSKLKDELNSSPRRQGRNRRRAS
jgi:hypothetical protein